MNQALFKTATFALLHFGVAFSVTFALTGSIAVATGVGLVEPLVNTLAFYFHERAWKRAEARRPTAARVTGADCGIVRAR
jgi:Predicted membrane protein